MFDAPDLTSYDVILINSSAGKDSQAMLDLLVELADQAGVRDRIVVVHADLGRVEWAGTRELAESQAAHYGLRFEVVKRPQGDLLDHVEERGMWPSSTARYCTSDHKRGQVAKLVTQLVAERRNPAGWVRNPDGGYAKRRVHILNCMGLRADESKARAKKPVFVVDERASNTKRHVDVWLPIHRWTERDVWARIEASGVPHHPAYDAGMPRLSCCFCVLASRSALVRAAQLNRSLASEYVGVELRINHRFRNDLSMAEIVAEADRTPLPAAGTPVEGWAA